MAAIEDGHHWRTIAVYGCFVAVVVAALAGYQVHTNHQLKKVDDASCANRLILVANQRTVLTILERNVAEFVRAAKDPKQHAYFVRTHRLVVDAQRRLDQTLICE